MLNETLKYRKEIDGIRAIAILAVIFFHAKKNFFGYNFFTGGFLGVDIFFVLSGFLITNILIDKIENNKNFSILHFYERRCRRILPVLLFIIICISPFVWAYFLQKDFYEYGKSILSSIYFFSNYFFYFNENLYNAGDSSFKPMLHTWSLSIEIQFYFFYPIIFYYLNKYYKQKILLIIISLFIISFSIMLIERINESWVFYNTASRIWEILLGCITAILKKKNNFLDKLNQDLLIIMSFFAMFIPLFVYSTNTLHPSFLTLLPVMGTCGLLLCEKKNNIIIQILSSKIFVFFGLISYSLYLWHFPIFAIGKTTEFFGDGLSKKLIVITFLLSLFSYYFVEKPFRKTIRKKKFIVITFSFLVFVSFLSYQIKSENIKSVRHNILPTLNVGDATRNLALCPYQETCVFNKDKNKKIFLFGDSHMQTLERPLLDFATNYNFSLTIMNKPTCFFLLKSDMYSKFNKICDSNYQEKRRSLVNDSKNSIVIMGGRTQLYFTGENFLEEKITKLNGTGFQLENTKKYDFNINLDFLIERLNYTINDLINSGNKVILIYPIPEVGWNVSRKIIQKLTFQYKNLEDLFFKKPLTTSYNFYKVRTKNVFYIFDQLKNPNLFKIYPDKIFCNSLIKDNCIVHDDKQVFYVDSDHLSTDGAKKIIEQIEIIIKKNKLN